MNVALAVFDALNSFNRKITRREIEREAGLSKKSVEMGLFTLRKMKLLAEEKHPRRLGLYGLVMDAERPQSRRGRYERTEPVRLANSRAATAYHSAAMPPSHFAAPGGVRLVIKGMLETQCSGLNVFSTCLLSSTWKRS